MIEQWAKEHGSELLRLRLAGEFEWLGLATVEYCDAVIAGLDIRLGPIDDDDDALVVISREDRTTPTLPEIETLNAIRTRIGDRPDVTAALVWYKYRGADGGTFHRSELEVTVTAPHGTTRNYYYAIPGTDNDDDEESED